MRVFREKVIKKIASVVLVSLLAQIGAPIQVFALGGGPSQSSTQGHSPVGGTEMVDLFTGDFKYDIPLLNLPGPDGGYPFNLSYNSNINIEQEASWVGLGWSLGPGAINRSLNGIPDEFNGDAVEVLQDVKNNVTVGVGGGFGFELWGLGIRFGGSQYYNTYNGFGVGTDVGIKIPNSGSDEANGKSAAFTTLDFGLDSQQGISADLSVSYAKNPIKDKYGGSGTVGIGYTSAQGLGDLSIGATISGKVKVEKKDGTSEFKSSPHNIGSSSIPLVGYQGLPSISTPMISTRGQASMAFGASIYTADPNGYVNGFYSASKIKGKFRDYNLRSYGLFNLENFSFGSTQSQMDFHRESQGAYIKESSNIHTSRLSPDRFMVSAAGLGGVFRGYRNEFGKVASTAVVAIGTNFNIGFDCCGTKWGVNGLGFGMNSGFSKSWEDDAVKDFKYVSKEGKDENFEPYYLKMEGEMTAFEKSHMDYMGGEKVARFDMPSKNFAGTPKLKRRLVGNSNENLVNEGASLENTTFKNEKRKRATAISFLKNSEIGDALPEYNISYYPSTSATATTPFNRSSLPGNHPAGYSIVNTGGSRYLFGLPVYNNDQVTCSFSADYNHVAVQGKSTSRSYENKYSLKTDVGEADYKVKGVTHTVPEYKHSANGGKNLRRTNISKYAHSYLLTSLCGPDYVDVSSDGLSDDDLGYWVKFDYAKTNNDFKWRAPFSQAMFSEGTSNADILDNTGSYTYGTKETYFLKEVQTKTHVAVFKISERRDAVGAKEELQDSDQLSTSNKSHKLDQIELYTKAEYNKAADERVPLKTVHFEYTYDLCPGVPNNDGAYEEGTVYSADGAEEENSDDINIKGGKLTLKKVYFTYQNNTRGKFNPYVFDYNENKEIDGQENHPLGDNPSYSEFMTDKWGNYSFSDERDEFFDNNDNINGPSLEYNNQLYNYKYPYVNQDRELRDKQVAVWSLKKIDLPTGSSIEVNYEADDYAYVQDQEAMKMFKIIGFGKGNPVNNQLDKNELESSGNRRVYFELEEKFKLEDHDLMKARYRKGMKELYFSVDITMKEKPSNTTGNFLSQQVQGWADVEDIGFDYENGESIRGYVSLKQEKGRGGNKDYHPISYAAWQYLDANMHRYARAVKDKNGTMFESDDPSENEQIAQIRGLLSLFQGLGTVFRGYYDQAKSKDWARHVHTDRSFIRLYSPNKKKIGGGSRVKRIVLNDNWDKQTKTANGTDSELNSVYGQVYDYTKTEIDTDGTELEISSGVAAYEPLNGGEENPLRQVKSADIKRRLKFNKEEFTTFPMNESYYPAPTVGYSQVMVQSLATAGERDDNDEYNIPAGIMTSGAVEYQFYTAQDYPVISEETLINKEKWTLILPLLLVNTFKKDQFATQGYMVTVNDMHGKPRKITQLEQNAEGEFVNKNAPYVEYKYKSKRKAFYDGRGYKNKLILDNAVSVLNGKYDATGENADVIKADDAEKPHYMGVEWDVTLDNIENHSVDFSLALSIDVDLTFLVFPVPLPSVWPRINNTETMFRGASFNKAIYKHGILEEVVAFDGQSTVSTKNEVYDPLSGQVVLSTVDNQYDQTLYNYTTPAHLSYEGMGSGIDNLGLKFGAKTSLIGEAVYLDENGNKTTAVTDHKEARFKVTSKDLEGGTGFDRHLLSPITEKQIEKLVSGDEFVTIEIESITRAKLKSSVLGKMTYLQKLSDDELLMVMDYQGTAAELNAIEDALNTSPGVIGFTLTKSGKTNQIAATDQSIVAKTNPLYDMTRYKCFNVVKKLETLDECVGRVPDLYDEEVANSYLDQVNAAYAWAKERGFPYIEGTYYDDDAQYHVDPNTKVYDLIYYTNILIGGFTEHKLRTIGFVNPNSMINNIGEFGSTTSRNYFASSASHTSGVPSTDFISELYRNGQFVGLCEPHLICMADDKIGVAGYQQYNDLIGAYVKYKDVDGQEKVYYGGIVALPYDKAAGEVLKKIIEDESTVSKFYYLLDDVLSINAQPFTDINSLSAGIDTYNPFRSGEKGIWKSVESYTYVQDREQMLQEEKTGEVDVKASGHMNDVTMFDPSNSFLTKCAPNWRKVSEVTKFNEDGYQLETKDILGIYSSALFNGVTEQNMAIAANARYDEIAFEDFESYEQSIYYTVTPLPPHVVVANTRLTNVAGGNFGLQISGIIESGKKHVKNKSLAIISGDGNKAIIAIDYDPDWGDENGELELKIDGSGLTTHNEKEIFGKYTCKLQPLYEGEGVVSGKAILEIIDERFTYTGLWSGSLQFIEELPYYTGGELNHEGLSIANVGHTGTHSLQYFLGSNTNNGSDSEAKAVLELRELNLQKGETYVFDAWTALGENTGSNSYASYDPASDVKTTTSRIHAGPSVEIGVVTTTGEVIWVSGLVKPSGNIIDGWQRISTELEIPTELDVSHLLMRLGNGYGVAINGSSGNIKVLYDDFRICPKDAEMATQVYDDLYRVVAKLDNRNYATFYHYDDQGALYLTRVETERGVRSVSYSKSNAARKK